MNATALTIEIPRVPVGQGFKAGIDFLQSTLGWLFDAISVVIEVCVQTLATLLTEPSATQLTLLAALVVASMLVAAGKARSAGIAVGVWLVLYLLEIFTASSTIAGDGVIGQVVGSMPGAFYFWAMALFGSDYVYPALILTLLLLAALVALVFTQTKGRTTRIVGIGAPAALVLFLVLHFILGVQLALLVVVLFVGLAALISGWQLAVFTAVGFLIILSMQKWDAAMSSLALIMVATLVAVAISVPIGILAASNDRVSSVMKPVLDFMQTLPAFVYLIPAISFFGIGQVPGIIATVIFAMPPGVRLTELGIRQVDKELVEAGEAFGAPDLQILRRIQLPLALATIMAGINQVIMLSLSMVVIAGMVGAGGLGNDVYTGIARSDIVVGFEGGIAVVILAIYLDRLTGAVTRFSPAARAERAATR